MNTTFKQTEKLKISRICKDAMGAVALVIILGACQSALDKPISTDSTAIRGQSQGAITQKPEIAPSRIAQHAISKKPNSTETVGTDAAETSTANQSQQVALPVSAKMVIFTGGTNSLPGDTHEQALRNFVGRIGAWQNIEQIKVIGHTDSTGSLPDNLRLSLERAQVTADRLQLMGLDSATYEVLGKGELSPMGDNRTRAGRAQNRRIEIEAQGLELQTGTRMAAKTELKAK